ncbi:hypothetical protein SERLA73DRAFT_61199, partial [Serpula lacrymans var. lacrymans S7.3]
FPEAVSDILSFHAVEKTIAEYSGVEYVEHDMCPELCIGFTGPFANLHAFPVCGMS